MVDGIFIMTPVDVSLMDVAWRNGISRNHGLDLVLRV